MANGLTVTKVVFEFKNWVLTIRAGYWLTVTKVVFEWAVAPGTAWFTARLTVTKVVFEYRFICSKYSL